MSSLHYSMLFTSWVLQPLCVGSSTPTHFQVPMFPTIAASVEQVWSNTKCIYYRYRLHFIGLLQLRLSMTSYSFIRENAYKVLHPWHKDDESGWCTNGCFIHRNNCHVTVLDVKCFPLFPIVFRSVSYCV